MLRTLRLAPFPPNNSVAPPPLIMASPRKLRTPNGCEVAKRVPREESGFRVPTGNIAAIDFGTTNCSVAYTTVGSGTEEVPVRLTLNTTYYRVPTAILFKPDGSIDSFGYDARTEYLNLDDEERLEYAYFEQIKMRLQHDEVLLILARFVGCTYRVQFLLLPHCRMWIGR